MRQTTGPSLDLTDFVGATLAAQECRVRVQRIYAALQTGQLEGVCHGGRWFVARASLRRFKQRLEDATAASGRQLQAAAR